MPAPYELKTLYDEKRYEDVIAFSNDPQELDAFSIWDFKYCMNSLYRLQKYTEALELYKIFHKKYPASGDLDNKTCWCLYYTKVKSYDDETGDPANLLKNVDFIIKHSDNSPYSPKWKVVDLITKNVGSRWKRLALKCEDQKQLQLINAVDPSTLSCDENTFQQTDGIQRKISSDREKWYSRKTKLLLKIEQYEECILCCDDALSAGFQFHSNNDIWFRFRKAKSLIALGQITACKDIIQEIGKSKFKHWCLEELCFDLARLDGNVTECLKYAGRCATADPSHDMRVKFYENLAFYLDDQEKTEYAALHRRLVLHVRKEKDWPLKQRHSEWIIPENISQLTKRATLQQLNALWSEWRNYGKEFHFGTIIRILNEDIDGFIHDDHGNKYYFKASDFTFRSSKPLAVGARVKFALEKRIDKKYNTEKDTAVEISYIE